MIYEYIDKYINQRAARDGRVANNLEINANHETSQNDPEGPAE